MKSEAKYEKNVPRIYEQSEYNKKITEAFVKVILFNIIY